MSFCDCFRITHGVPGAQFDAWQELLPDHVCPSVMELTCLRWLDGAKDWPNRGGDDRAGEWSVSLGSSQESAFVVPSRAAAELERASQDFELWSACKSYKPPACRRFPPYDIQPSGWPFIVPSMCGYLLMVLTTWYESEGEAELGPVLRQHPAWPQIIRELQADAWEIGIRYRNRPALALVEVRAAARDRLNFNGVPARRGTILFALKEAGVPGAVPTDEAAVPGRGAMGHTFIVATGGPQDRGQIRSLYSTSGELSDMTADEWQKLGRVLEQQRKWIAEVLGNFTHVKIAKPKGPAERADSALFAERIVDGELTMEQAVAEWTARDGITQWDESQKLADKLRAAVGRERKRRTPR